MTSHFVSEMTFGGFGVYALLVNFVCLQFGSGLELWCGNWYMGCFPVVFSFGKRVLKRVAFRCYISEVVLYNVSLVIPSLLIVSSILGKIL